MSKNLKITQLDPRQIEQRVYEEEMDATRVILVGGEKLDLSINNDQLAEAVKQGLSQIKIETSAPQIKDVEFVTIERPVFIEKIVYKEIEKPVIITKTEYKTIEVPIVIKEIEIREIEKERHYPLVLKICAVIQAATVICILLTNLLRK